MNHIAQSSLLYASLAELTSIVPACYERDLNLNLRECLPAGERLEENFACLLNGYHTDDQVPLVEDFSVNQTAAVEFLLINHTEEFVAVLHQASYTARQLEAAYEMSGDLDKADIAHKIRRQLVAVTLAHFSSDPIEG